VIFIMIDKEKGVWSV